MTSLVLTKLYNFLHLIFTSGKYQEKNPTIFSVFISNGINIAKRSVHNQKSFCYEDYVFVTKNVCSRLESVNENSLFKEYTLIAIFKTY